MDRQERIKILQELALEKVGCAKFKSWEALTEQIAEAELMERVSGGVEKRRYSPRPEKYNEDYNYAYADKCDVFNEAIDLCNAHWAGKMAGIEKIINVVIAMCSLDHTERQFLKNTLRESLITHLTAK